jgi:hypothetical protein
VEGTQSMPGAHWESEEQGLQRGMEAGGMEEQERAGMLQVLGEQGDSSAGEHWTQRGEPPAGGAGSQTVVSER